LVGVLMPSIGLVSAEERLHKLLAKRIREVIIFYYFKEFLFFYFYFF
jgi:hypothetical protein